MNDGAVLGATLGCGVGVLSAFMTVSANRDGSVIERVSVEPCEKSTSSGFVGSLSGVKSTSNEGLTNDGGGGAATGCGAPGTAVSMPAFCKVAICVGSV